MPEPKKGESRSEYVARYMGSSEAKKSFPNKKQRLAVAFSKHRRRGKVKESVSYSEALRESSGGQT